MPQRYGSAAPGSDRRQYAAFIVAAGVALGCLAGAALAAYQSVGHHSPLLVPSSFVLCASGLWQAWLLWTLLQARCLQRLRVSWFCVQFWQSLLSGAAVLYLIGLCLGAISGLGWAWLAAVALWLNFLLLPLAASPQVTENWRRWAESHRPGRLNWLVAASLAVLGIGEGTLRVQKLIRRGKPAPESIEFTRLEANAGNTATGTDWTLGLDRGRFRVALLSDAASSATQLAALSQRVQQAVPGAHVMRLEVTLAEADETRLAAELAAAGPDVVLAVLPACSEWAPHVTRRGLFDRHRFELSRVVFRGEEPVLQEMPEAPADYESFLNLAAADLAACRTPLDDAMRARWERTFAALDGAVDTCRTAGVPLAMVVVPGELQLNEGLRTTLVRRCGMTPEQVDVELPQRRLAGYSQLREVPLVDLLPSLRLCRQAVYARHQTVLNEHGNVEAAAAIGGWLESRFADQMAELLSRNP